MQKQQTTNPAYKAMKTDKIVWGLILVFIGGIFLLENFNVINFYWGSVWRLWPLFLVVLGANMLFNRGTGKAGAFIAASITIIALVFIGYQGSRPREEQRNNWSFRYNDDGDNDNSEKPARKSSTNTFTEAYNASTRRAELSIKGGATSYQLKNTTDNLFDADVKQSYGNYSLDKVTRDSVEILNFRMRQRDRNWDMGDTDGNQATIRLNERPVWDINVEVGAGEIDFDLTTFKIRNLELKGGAASFDIKLGKPLNTTSVNVETGVAEVKIAVPQDAACQIKVQSGLSSKDFEGFTKQADNTYTTTNFVSAPNKIIINLKGGLSQFEVRRN